MLLQRSRKVCSHVERLRSEVRQLANEEAKGGRVQTGHVFKHRGTEVKADSPRECGAPDLW